MMCLDRRLSSVSTRLELMRPLNDAIDAGEHRRATNEVCAFQHFRSAVMPQLCTYRVGQKPDRFKTFVTRVRDGTEKRSTYPNVPYITGVRL